MTPEQLRDRLIAALQTRWTGRMVDSYHASSAAPGRQLPQRLKPGMGYHDAYYEGDHELAFATAAYWEAFGPYLGATADNFMPLVVDSAVERLRVQGLRLGRATGADQLAWDFWQDNDMDLGSDQVHRDAIKLGVAYWMVEKPDGDDAPLITPEHPAQMIVQCSPANPRERLSALKLWAEHDGTVRCNLWTEERLEKWRKRPTDPNLILPPGVKAGEWEKDAGDSGEHGLDEVPVIPVPNVPSMGGHGISDLAPVEPDQQNINKMLADMMLGSEYQAWPQRVLLGVEQMQDENGVNLTAEQAQLALSRTRILRFSSKEAKIDQWDPADLKNYVEARNHLLDGLFSKGRLPINYNARGQLANISADALRAAEKNLIARCEMKKPGFDGGHEDTVRLAFKAVGADDKAKQAMSAEVMWRSLEARTEAELADAAVKKQAIGIPEEIIWEDMGYSPQQIERIKALKLVDGLLEPEPLETPPDPALNGNGPPERVPVA
jgi:hypothetical protein